MLSLRVIIESKRADSLLFLLDLSLLDAHLEEDLRTKVVVVKAIQEVFCKEVHSLKSHADKSYDIPLILGLPPNNVEVSLSRVKKAQHPL